MSSYQKFTKDIAIIGVTQLIIFLNGAIVLPIITKLLGPKDYGVWAQIIATISFITPIATLGLADSMLRFLASEKNRGGIQEGMYSVFVIVLLNTLIISGFLFLFATPISNFFGVGKILVQILSLIIILECIINSVFLNFFRSFQEIKKCSFFLIFQTFGEVGLIFLAAVRGYGLLGAVLALLVIRIVLFLIMGGLILKKIGGKIPNFSKIREYLQFGLPAVSISVSSLALQSSDRYLIGFFLGGLFVGYYAPAYLLGVLPMLFAAPFSFTLPTLLPKLYDENRIDEVKTYLKYSLKYFLMIAIPSALGLSILSKQLLLILSTSEIAQQGYLITPIIALSILLLGTNNIAPYQVILLKKKTKVLGAIGGAAAFLNIGINFILIPRFGIFGAAFAILLAYAFIFILTWYYAFKDLQFEIDWSSILKTVIASALMAFLIIEFKLTTLPKTVLAIIFGALFYGVLMLLFGGINRAELEFLKSLFRKS